MRESLINYYGFIEPVSDKIVDAEIVSVVRKLNLLGFVQSRFSCAGYGPTARYGETGKDHRRRELAGAYLVVVYPTGIRRTPGAQQFHNRMRKIATFTEWHMGQVIYWMAGGRGYHEDAKSLAYARQLVRELSFWKEELAKTKVVWAKVEAFIDDTLKEQGCSSPTPLGPLSSTGSFSGAAAATFSGTGRIVGKSSAHVAASGRLSSK